MPPMTKDAIISSIERLILTSTPFQTVLMKIRHVYRWEDPMETAIYLVLYFALWAVNYLTGAAVNTHFCTLSMLSTVRGIELAADMTLGRCYSLTYLQTSI
jgi:hypothetical protein